MPVLEARQLVKEQIGVAESAIPPDLGAPELMPITPGLGEIYQYVLVVKPGFESRYDPMELRTIQDWIIKRQLAGGESSFVAREVLQQTRLAWPDWAYRHQRNLWFLRQEDLYASFDSSLLLLSRQ